MSKIKDEIIAKLREIEDKEKVRILYAVESGSRGWGFESKDSDYDVRFIYAHPVEWYLSIGDKRDVIEYPISDLLDISGWDIKKALKLFKNSNPPLYEWLTSPIIYMEQANFTHKLKDLMPKFYLPTSAMHHYLHMAQGNHKAYLTGKKIKIKKYFYVLRPILACMWIEKYGSMPSMEFDKLLSAQDLNTELIKEIKRLHQQKKLGIESDVEDRSNILVDFLEKKVTYFEVFVKKLTPKRKLADNSLDKLFRENLYD